MSTRQKFLFVLCAVLIVSVWLVGCLPPKSDLRIESVSISSGPGIDISSAPVAFTRGSEPKITLIVYIDNSQMLGGEPSFSNWGDVGARLTLATAKQPNEEDEGDHEPEVDDIYLRGFDPLTAEMAINMTREYYPGGDGWREQRLHPEAPIMPDGSTIKTDIENGLEVVFHDLAADIDITERLEWLNYEVNAHTNPRPSYSVNYTDITPNVTYAIFTFPVPTGDLILSRTYTYTLTVDPESYIAESNEGNNEFSDTFTVEPSEPEFDFEVLQDPLNPYVAPCEDYSNIFNVRIKTPRYWTGRSTTEHGDLLFWQEEKLPKYYRRHMHFGEVWGPQADAKNADVTPFYPNAVRPEPEDVRHVMLFHSGYSGCAVSCAATGQMGDTCPTWYHDGYGDYRRIRHNSWAGQLVIKESDIGYPKRENSLLHVSFQNKFRQDMTGESRRKVLRGYLRYLDARTNGMQNVETILIGGASRGGILTLRLGQYIERNFHEDMFGEGSRWTRDPREIKFVLINQDAAEATPSDFDTYDSMGAYLNDDTYHHCSDEIQFRYEFNDCAFTFEKFFIYNAVGGWHATSLIDAEYHGSVEGAFDDYFFTQHVTQAINHHEMCTSFEAVNDANNAVYNLAEAIRILYGDDDYRPIGESECGE